MNENKQVILQNSYKLIARVLIFAISGESILLIKGSPTKKIWPSLYNGIGGHVEKGEDFLSAAHREFSEETGLDLINPQLKALITIDASDNSGIGMAVFTAQMSEGKLIASFEGELELVPLNKLNDFPLVEDLPILIPKVLELNKNSPPLFGHYSYTNGELNIKFAE